MVEKVDFDGGCDDKLGGNDGDVNGGFHHVHGNGKNGSYLTVCVIVTWYFDLNDYKDSMWLVILLITAK